MCIEWEREKRRIANEERIDQAQKWAKEVAEREQELMDATLKGIQAFASRGLQGIVSDFLGFIANVYLPGSVS